LLTIFVVVATANHYWLDGIAACALLVPAWLVARAIEQLRSRVRVPELSGERELEPVGLPQIQQGASS
jgi:hypothetical protein